MLALLRPGSCKRQYTCVARTRGLAAGAAASEVGLQSARSSSLLTDCHCLLHAVMAVERGSLQWQQKGEQGHVSRMRRVRRRLVRGSFQYRHKREDVQGPIKKQESPLDNLMRLKCRGRAVHRIAVATLYFAFLSKLQSIILSSCAPSSRMLLFYRTCVKTGRAVLIALGLLAALACTTSAADFSCGKPGSVCGSSIPANVRCPKGQGYCDPGYFCGWIYSETDKTTKCMPVPKDCGKEGNSCCPGNNIKPITNSTSTPEPYCTDGSYCFYTPTMDASGWSSPPFSSPANLLGTCRKVPKDCGTGPGKPCCPSLYLVRVNPKLSIPQLCSGNTFCYYAAASSTGWKENQSSGVCVANKPGCGKFGKSCCITTTGVATSNICGAQWNEPGPKGYCAYLGSKATNNPSDQICLTCPDPKIVAADPQKYWGCPAP